MTFHYVTEAQAAEVNRKVTGSPDLLVEPMLLRSAVSRQWAGYGDTELYPALEQKAGALFHGLIANHAFADGNKRTALVCMALLCDMNGRPLRATEDEVVDFAVSVASEHPTVEEVIGRTTTMMGRRVGPIFGLS